MQNVSIVPMENCTFVSFHRNKIRYQDNKNSDIIWYFFLETDR